jgi:hypothetical protein
VVLALAALLSGVSLTSASTRARAADGTVLRTITAQDYSCGVGTGIAFDGHKLFLSCWGSNDISAIDPANGNHLQTFTIGGVQDLGALAWDRGRNRLWACDSGSTVYLIDLGALSSSLQFTSQGCVDGLAYDGSDDTIYSSADVAGSVQHYKTNGVLLSSLDVSGKLGACGNSGLAVGGAWLFLSNDGCSEIYKATKDLSQVSQFGSYPARLEDLECDDVTFKASGKAAIWSKDAYDGVLNAFELNPGDCGFGGFSPASDRMIAHDAQEPSMAVNPTDPKNIVVGYNAVRDDKIACGYASTQDGGATWAQGVLSSAPGLDQSLGDPSVAFSRSGVAYLTCLAGGEDHIGPIGLPNGDNGVVIASSTDQGRSFSTPTEVFRSFQSPIGKAGTFADQENLAAGIADDSLYTCWALEVRKGTLLGSKRERWQIEVSRALNARGTIWSDPVAVATYGQGDTPLGCTVAVTGTGRVWVAWWNTDRFAAQAAYSDSRAKRFSKPITLGAKGTNGDDDSLVGRHVWIRAEPVVGSNRVAAAWATSPVDADEAVTRLRWTADHDFSPPANQSQVSPAGVTTRQPTLAWGSDGKLAVGYYDRKDSQLHYTVGQATTPGGAFTFKAVASQASNASSNLEPFSRLADYTAVIEMSGHAYAAWTDNRSGRQEVWFGS